MLALSSSLDSRREISLFLPSSCLPLSFLRVWRGEAAGAERQRRYQAQRQAAQHQDVCLTVLLYSNSKKRNVHTPKSRRSRASRFRILLLFSKTHRYLYS